MLIVVPFLRTGRVKPAGIWHISYVLETNYCTLLRTGIMKCRVHVGEG